MTAPPSVPRREIDRVVAGNGEWIESARRRLARRRAGLPEEQAGLAPLCIALPALGECWRVDYRSGAGNGIRVEETAPASRLSVRAADPDEPTIARALRRWLKRRARRALAPQAVALADEFGLPVGRISIRNQRSRWGSCSRSGNLSLNARLLFCSPQACRYVLIHELVHIEHPNHSPAFWRRVAELEPRYRDSIRELSGLRDRLPEWVIAGS